MKSRSESSLVFLFFCNLGQKKSIESIMVSRNVNCRKGSLLVNDGKFSKIGLRV